MFSDERHSLPDEAGLSFETSISASTKAGHKVVSLIAMPKKKV